MSMIGNNIRTVRLEKHMSQQDLADKCGFANTTLSAYENGRKDPGLNTIARIAKELSVPMERLYYGDETISFIQSEANDGRKIVNALYYLWSMHVISYFENSGMPMMIPYDESDIDIRRGIYLRVEKNMFPIRRFMKALNEFEQNRDTYENPDQYLEMLKASVAREINNAIKNGYDDTGLMMDMPPNGNQKSV